MSNEIEKQKDEEEPVRVRFQCCIRTMPFEFIFNAEGFLICPEHHERRYGWRSPRLKRYELAPFNPENPQYIWRPVHGESHLERDQAIVRELLGPIE